MKCNIKAKDFDDKATLEKTLSAKLKKPLMALKKKSVEELPFCYEVDFFSEGKGFMSIGVAKEIQKLYKSKRSKGQGTDENGKAVKVDKKKVAFGVVTLNDAGQFEFNVKGGMMKKAQAKKVIKSIPLLKKTIGDNFLITKGDSTGEDEDVTVEEKDEAKKEPVKLDAKEQVKEMKKLFDKIKKRLKEAQNEIIPRIKTLDSTQEDLSFLDHLPQTITEFLTLYKECPKQVQKKFEEAYDKFKEQREIILKRAKRAREIVTLPDRVEAQKEAAAENATAVINRMREIQKRIVEIRKELAS